MTTYAIKVQNTMRPTNPRYSTEGPMTLYYYIWIVVWMIFTAFRNMLKCSKKLVALF